MMMRIDRLVCFFLGMGLGLTAYWSLPPSYAQEDFARDFPRLSTTDWPWWRGPNRQGHAFHASVPFRISDLRNAEWKTPIPGRGHSSPIVIGSMVFLTTAIESSKEQSVIGLQLENGQIAWQKPLSQGGFPEVTHPKNTEATSTIASDGKSLFVVFLHHDQVHLYSLSLDGDLEWSKVVGTYQPMKYRYGYAPSPLLYQNSVIVTYEYDGPCGLVAFDRTTGEELWRTERRPACSYSSPAIAHIAGRDQLLLSGGDLIASYDPSNGKEWWSTPGTTEVTCGTMVWDGQIVFASGGYPKSETIALDAGQDGKVLWRNDQKCYEQSMVAFDGYLYALTSKGVMYCWRAVDGQEMWKERLTGPVSASGVLVGSHIFWANELGTIYVVRANPERFELTAENEVGDEAFASPALSRSRMLLRVASLGNAQRQEYLYSFRDLTQDVEP